MLVCLCLLVMLSFFSGPIFVCVYFLFLFFKFDHGVISNNVLFVHNTLDCGQSFDVILLSHHFLPPLFRDIPLYIAYSL